MIRFSYAWMRPRCLAGSAVLLALLVPSMVTRAQSYDLVFADAQDSPLCVNDGTARFGCASVLAAPNAIGASGLGAVDLEGDGDTDLVFTGVAQSNRVCVNDGAGTFSCQSLTDARAAFAVAPADFDGDGDLDLAFANSAGVFSSGVNWLCLNDGAGTFSCQDIAQEAYVSYDVQAADLDADGDADLVFARNGTNRVCLNSGRAAFTCADLSAERDFSFGVLAADLDGDGDADLAFANGLSTAANQLNQVCLNDGGAAFACSYIRTGASASRDVAAADFDQDGDVDLAFATSGQANGLCLNSGSGAFSCVNIAPESTESQDVVAADFNGDGIPDLAFANYGEPHRVCLTGPTGFVCADVSVGLPEGQGVVAVRNLQKTVAVSPEARPVHALGVPTPHPVGQQAQIPLQVSRAQHVRVAVYDVQGRCVAVLYDAVRAPHEQAPLSLETAAWAPGVYVLRVTGETFTATRSFVVAR